MPRADPADSFSYTELALAGGISKGAYQFLAGSGLLPGGRGIRDFKRLAVIGAFMAGGVSMLTAAAISKAVIEGEFNQKDGEAPSGIENLFMDYFRRLESPKDFPPPDSLNDYWLHLSLFEAGLETAVVRQDDTKIEIVDRQFVFLRNPFKVGKMFSRETEDASLTGWLEEDGKRSADLKFIPLFKRVDILNAERDEMGDVTQAFKDLYLSLDAQAQAARVNAIGILTVNLSLSIRRALDRLARARGVSGGGSLAPQRRTWKPTRPLEQSNPAPATPPATPVPESAK